MEEKELLHRVLQIIKDIENYTDTFVSYDSIPLVEVEIALDKTKILYDVLHQLKHEIVYGNSVHGLPQKEESIIDFNAIEVEFELQPKEQQDVSQNVKIVKEEQVPIEIIEEKEPEIIIETPSIEPVKDEIPSIAIQPEKEEVKEIVTPEIKKEIANSVLQSILHVKSDNDLGSKLGKKPIANISSAIGINDRFQYVKELFGNDISSYNSAIQALNSALNFDSALEYINSNFEWDIENATVQSFLSIVERRFL